ncbi:ATP-binding protein [Vibrio parahaemolyticus]|nr:ATP-binding protein [Vibrio parahaemolyticus]MDF5038160.1 ATP-binding protein [Vibrio parahaemolyticus]MDF5324091.1 ATP-binding protein [Vibrio parahaemolyticus]MDF5686904.1 ATP-binding protein [Vibrio parahaemolyticus]HCH5913363.1 ATP-binding protein [Vibrio parahaemolyticus]
MAIQGFDREKFFNTINSVLSSSEPIRSYEMLYGRSKQLDELEFALNMNGRHAFILGDRGVGKSSLAMTAAYQIQSSDNKPVIVTCDKHSTLVSVAKSILSHAVATVDFQSQSRKLALNIPGLKYEVGSESDSHPSLPEITDVMSAALVLSSLSKWHSRKPVVVIDEFDQVSQGERQSFGVLLKHLGDSGADVKLIFTGIGHSLGDLLDGHLSSSRQLHQVKLDVLSWDGRFEIIDRAFERFGIKIPEDFRFKIAGLSDGFPNYVHLICEKLLYEAYSSEDLIAEIDRKLFLAGLDDAIESVSETLRRSYDKATQGRAEHLHHILWAMADSSDLIRRYEHFLNSYHQITEQLGVEPLEKDRLKREFAKLRKGCHGSILERGLGNRPSWFKFSENILRGFIRMYAEQNGITVDFVRSYTAQTASVRSVRSQKTYQPLTEVERNTDWIRSRK